MLQHINDIKTLAEQLDAVGAPVSEDDRVITLLASLSESYAFLITRWSQDLTHCRGIS